MSKPIKMTKEEMLHLLFAKGTAYFRVGKTMYILNSILRENASGESFCLFATSYEGKKQEFYVNLSK